MVSASLFPWSARGILPGLRKVMVIELGGAICQRLFAWVCTENFLGSGCGVGRSCLLQILSGCLGCRREEVSSKAVRLYCCLLGKEACDPASE